MGWNPMNSALPSYRLRTCHVMSPWRPLATAKTTKETGTTQALSWALLGKRGNGGDSEELAPWTMEIDVFVSYCHGHCLSLVLSFPYSSNKLKSVFPPSLVHAFRAVMLVRKSYRLMSCEPRKRTRRTREPIDHVIMRSTLAWFRAHDQMHAERWAGQGRRKSEGYETWRGGGLASLQSRIWECVAGPMGLH